MTVVIAVVVSTLVVAIAALVWMVRSVREELATAVSRFADHPSPPEAEVIGPDLLTPAMDAVLDGVVIVDAAGREILRNAAGERFRRARHTEALVEDAIQELLVRARSGEAGQRDLQLFGPPVEMLQLRAVPLSWENTLVGAVAFVRDISELRRIDSMRRDFVANVSHELKTPIGALALLAETMAEGNDPEVTRQLADRVHREAERLGNIVDDLLDLSLIEAQEAPARGPVPVYVVLHEAVERVRPAADATGIPIEVAPMAADLVTAGDRAQLVSALTNVLENAVKYSDSAGAVEVNVTSSDTFVSIAVRDQGIGIPASDLERIFERFYRVDRARSRATGGTGLGLSIVRHIAQAHGGDVTVESIEGEGSTFRLRLPLAQSAGRDLSEAS